MLVGKKKEGETGPKRRFELVIVVFWEANDVTLMTVVAAGTGQSEIPPAGREATGLGNPGLRHPGPKNSHIKIGTLNIRSGQNGNLEAACKSMEALGMDLCILTEVKFTKRAKFTKSHCGYKILATEAVSAHKGGVAICVKEQRKGWDVEDYETFGPNVIACTLVSGALRRRVIGAYVSPSEGNGDTMDYLTMAVMSTTLEPLILGDFNVNLRNVAEDLNPDLVPNHASAQVRQAEIVATLTSFGVENFGAHFRQRIRTGTWTWQMKRQGQPVRSICDYILGVRGLLSEREVFHQVRRPEYVSTDHRVIYIGLPMGNSKVHQTYMHGRTTFPIAIPVQSKGLVDHLHDSW